jgi:hypothetical protein
MIFERLSAFTRDSIIINLKTDTTYASLLQRIAKASNAELAPKIDMRYLDGYSISINVITTDKNMQIGISNPEANTHPLLFAFVINTLDKRKNSNAIKKIRKYYTEFK